MSVQVNDQNLGHATAYGYASSKGYTGTEDEFAELMASYADVAEQAAESAEQAAASATTATAKASEAAQSATAAASSKTAAETAQGGAETAAQTATTKAGEASTAATTATNKATEATTAATTATGKATEAAGSATTATTKAGEASTSATNAAASATRAQEILDSIPADYSQLSDDVEDLKDGLTAVESDVTDLKEDLDGAVDVVGTSEIEFLTGKYITTTGSTVNWENPSSASSYDCAVVPCSEGDIFIITASGGGGARLYAFINSSNQVVGTQADSYVNAIESYIQAPQNAVKLIINVISANAYSCFKGVGVDTIADEAFERTDNDVVVPNKNLFDRSKAKSGYYLVSQNPISIATSATQSVSDYIKIASNSVYRISTATKIAFFDENKIGISVITDSSDSAFNFTTPSNAKFLRFCYTTASANESKLMLIDGSEDIDYRPFEMTVNESKVLPQIVDYSANLLTPFVKIFSNTSIYSSGEHGGETTTLNNYSSTDYIVIKGNTSYTFKYRHTLAWYDSDKVFISGVSSSNTDKTLTSPTEAVFVRFSWPSAAYPETRFNEGTTLSPESETNPVIYEKYLPQIEHGLTITNIKLPVHGIADEPINLNLVAAKCISKEGCVPDYTGYLFYEESTQKFYYSSNADDNPEYLFDWDSSLANNEDCKYWCATITADGDVIFLRMYERRNPIVYPNTDYSTPYVVDFGDNKKPYGWLMSGSVTQFDDGSFVYGDYAYHSQTDEQNDDRRIIWHVSKPYNNAANWEQAHSFKHVYQTSSKSDEPDNEIGHIHAVMYDFYSDDLYCTTGDIDRHCRMWISTDHGDTWSAVPNAVGTTEDTTVQAEGQKWRMTGAIFLPDYMYWATDSFYQYHNLWRCSRDASGHVDFSTMEKICNLEIDMSSSQSQATYITSLVRNPFGLLFIDRAEPRTDGKLDVKFYDFEHNSVGVCLTLDEAETDVTTLEQNNRIGLPNQFGTWYQPQSVDGIFIGSGKYIRPNTTALFNNSLSNYVGALKLKVT